MTAGQSKAPAADGVPKHRACDECRCRKLACSKEPDGCSRCKREGILCHYSPQKPMGRPRKRRHVEESPPSTDSLNPGAYGSGHEGSPLSLPGSGSGSGSGSGTLHRHGNGNNEFDLMPSSAHIPLGPGVGFWDHAGDTNVNFLDLLPDSFFHNTDGNLAPQNECQSSLLDHGDCDPASAFHMGLGDMQFTNPDPVSKDMNHSFQQFMTTQNSGLIQTHEEPELDYSTPGNRSSVVSHSEESTESQSSHGMRALPTISCGCLSSLYLALDSLSHIPHDVPAAMRVVRNASKIAQDVVDCPYCFNMEDYSRPPPIQSFQNLMCLGALVPSACNAYAQILQMVDDETARAKSDHRNIWFTIKDIGGLWGNLGEGKDYSALQRADNTNLAPDVWRKTIRDVLRLDIYGVEGQESPAFNAQSSQQGQPKLIGLKNVLIQLDEKASTRHEKVDRMVAAGEMPSHSPYILCSNKPVPREQRNCARVIETARSALDSLVIS